MKHWAIIANYVMCAVMMVLTFVCIVLGQTGLAITSLIFSFVNLWMARTLKRLGH